MGNLFIFGMYLAIFASYGAKSAQNQIDVRLFGQRCRLTGPIPVENLQAVHQMSPGMMPPPERLDQAVSMLKRIEEVKNLPPSLDRYREKLSLRMEGLKTLYTAIEKFQKSQDGAELGKLIADLPRVRQRKFQPLLAPLGIPLGVSPSPTPSPTPAPQSSTQESTSGKTEALEKFIELYRDSIQKDPEEDFHRTIRKLGIHYVCDFDELEPGDEPSENGKE